METKRVAVMGAGGFIGNHLVKYLKKKGYWVRGVDTHKPYYSQTEADEFLDLNLTSYLSCLDATKGVEEVYQLAADMGGMGFITENPIASLYNSNLINTYIPEACISNNVKRVFFSSSACVYPIDKQATLEKHIMREEDAMPANPNEAYGWEKLFAEVRYLEYHKAGKFETRIARFENCYGPECTYDGGREKSPAALCRKVAMAKEGEYITVWGDGYQMRSFMYIDDCVEGIHRIMRSDHELPFNLGEDSVISINELAEKIIEISGKNLTIKHVNGPQGVRSRYIDHYKARMVLKWETKFSFDQGLRNTYNWIASQIEQANG